MIKPPPAPTRSTSAATLIAEGYGDRRLAAALGITRHAARVLIQEAELRKVAAAHPADPVVAPQANSTSGEFHPLANLFPMIQGEHFQDLVADIGKNGLREPVVILDGKILDGRNRFMACREAGIAPTLQPFRPNQQGDPLDFVISKNLKRRHLNESQRAMVAARIANLSDGQRTARSANSPTSPTTQPQAAKRLSVSERTLRAARSVQTHGVPELVRAVDTGHLAVSAAAMAANLEPDAQRKIAEAAEAGTANAARTVIKAESRAVRESELAAKIATGNLALPRERFGVILADPEWRYEAYSRATGLDRAPDHYYPTSTTANIAARPVRDIAADDCVLFLWATQAMLPDALDVMKAWGFVYKSQFIWRKVYPGNQVGIGHWNRSVHEHLLIGTSGRVPAPAPGTQWPSVIEGEVRGHSVKPDWVYDLIEQYFPNLPKMEMNARRARLGWRAWGLDAPPAALEPGEIAAAGEHTAVTFDNRDSGKQPP